VSTAVRSTIKRHPERGSHETEAVHAVLDAAPLGHLGFVVDGQPFVIPMLYGRIDEAIYLHGSVASRLLRTMADGVEVCLTATLVDGLVLARSAFHHSMNYRSAVVFGRAIPVHGDEKVAALQAISEHLRPGRWDEVRPPSAVELRQTAVLRLEVEEMSAKARTGGPIDEPEDLDLPVWAGVVPCTLAWGTPEPG
jgi:nitroimidazol reductase NimA-like FMN-containing flavoprotein (pyridoxamine 5'-phosphate oxidase superfamily)